MADLTTTQAVKDQLNITISGDDSLIATFVSQASSMIESFCNQRLIGSPGTLKLDAAPPHLYSNHPRRIFFGEPLLGVYSVTNGDGSTISSSDYQLLPLNDSPKYGLELTIEGGEIWQYDDDWKGAITVAGTRGLFLEADKPNDITLAATKLAAWLYQRRDNTGGEIVRFADGSTQIPGDAPGIVFNILRHGRYVRDMIAT